MAKEPPLQNPSTIAELPLPPGKKASDYLSAYKGTGYACVRAISNDMAAIHLSLYKRKYVRGKPEINEVTEHEALSLLEYVNDFGTFYDLVESTSVYNEISGEAFWLFLRPTENGMPSEIWPLRPDWVTIIPSKKEVIKSYRYKPGGLSESVDFEPDDILHFKNFNPKKMSRGFGSVQAAAMELDLDDFAASWSRNFFFNAAIPSLALKIPKDIDMTEDQIKRMVEQWRSSFSGVRQSHKVAVLTGGIEAEPLSADLKDLGMVEQRTYVRDQILSIFQVPKAVIAITDDVNRANADATIRAYMDRTIKPKMTKFVGQLNEFYLRRFWPNEDIFFDFADPVPEDAEMKLKIYENGLKNGWLTINEVREEENKSPVQGGDSIYLPLILQPVGAVKNAVRGLFNKDGEPFKLDKKKKKMPKKFNGQIPHKRIRDIREKALEKDIKPQIKKLLSNVIRLSESEVRRENMWRQFIAKTDVWEEIMQEKSKLLFSEQEAIVVSNLEKRKKAAPADAEVARYLFDLANENEKWRNELEPVLRQILKEQGRDTLDFLGLPGDLDLTLEKAVNYLENEVGSLVKGINETTLNDLRITLAEGVIAGEGIGKLKSRVGKVFTQANRVRSEMIARTEVIRASNFATQLAYQQSSVVSAMEWLTSLDARVCPICQPLDGKVVSLNKQFKTSVGAVDHPPAHPRCRCTLIPVLSERSVKPSKTKKKVKSNVSDQQIKELIGEAKIKVDKMIVDAEKKIKDAKVEAKKIVVTAKKKAKKEEKGLISEFKKIRDKARDVLNG